MRFLPYVPVLVGHGSSERQTYETSPAACAHLNTHCDEHPLHSYRGGITKDLGFIALTNSAAVIQSSQVTPEKKAKR
ncbi:MAG TPA: hypothetical protein VKA59_23690 [Vicinamibacterales bacterium]|nr:hypothetical protein [Vicinamibacterales bacterium]